MLKFAVPSLVGVALAGAAFAFDRPSCRKCPNP